MITMTRSLARHLRAVLRRAGFKPRSVINPPLSFVSGPDGLRIRALVPDVAIEYRLPGEYPVAELTVALELLDDCQGKHDEPVTLEPGKKKKTIARWSDSGAPHLIEYDAEPLKRPFPVLPETFTSLEPAFWQALREASQCTDDSPTRYALNNIFLRSDTGHVVATDGRQVYLHEGFQFPWTGDVLIPALGVLGCADLAGEMPIEIGKTGQSLALRIGNWTLALGIDTTGRIPNLKPVLEQVESGHSLLQLSPPDAQFLAARLPKLLRDDSDFRGVTLDLNGQVIVRAQRDAEAAMTEVLLSQSATAGPPIRIAMNRKYLLHALGLGFTEFRFTDPNRAMIAADKNRKYVWMPLDPKGALGPAKDAIRIESPPAGVGHTQTQSQSKRRRTTMSKTSTATAPVSAESAVPASTETRGNAESADASAPPVNGEPLPDEAQPNGQVRRRFGRKSGRSANVGAIEQAIALRETLREFVNKTNELIRSLKRQRQQSRLVQSTLASLKQLQQAG